MAFTTADVEALKRAIATGASEVRFADGRQVTNRPLSELMRILAMAEAEATGAPARVHSVAGF